MKVLTLFVRFGTEKYPAAEAEVAAIFERQMPDVDRTVVVVDNALPPGIAESSPGRVVIGGDNTLREFSAFEQGLRHVGTGIWRYDLIHFATEAFNTLYVEYLTRFDSRLLGAAVARPVCVGHVDCYNAPVTILGFRSQHWIRSCFFFLNPADVALLGNVATVRDGARFFSGSPADPFRADAPLCEVYRNYITDWLTGQDIGQGVSWHSRLAPSEATLSTFEAKATAIINEQMLGVRLRAQGCRTIDVTWLSTMLARHNGSDVPWKAHWRDQLSNRDRDALRLA
jgi:hypothetical protein